MSMEGNVIERLKQTTKTLRCAVNELCIHCGAYRNEHHGYCDSCKWLKVKRDLAEQADQMKRGETQ